MPKAMCVGRREGTGKDGNPYMIIYYTGEERGVEGEATGDFFLREDFLLDPPELGDRFIYSCDKRGYLVELEKI